jgi:hypothetical protein
MIKTQLKTEQRIEDGKTPTLSDVADDLNAGHYDALYYATYKQMYELVDQKRIDEDLLWKHDDYQSEMSSW